MKLDLGVSFGRTLHQVARESSSPFSAHNMADLDYHQRLTKFSLKNKPLLVGTAISFIMG